MSSLSILLILALIFIFYVLGTSFVTPPKNLPENPQPRSELESRIREFIALSASAYPLDSTQRQTLMRAVQSVSDDRFLAYEFPVTGTPEVDHIFSDLKSPDGSTSFRAYMFLSEQFPCFASRSEALSESEVFEIEIEITQNT